MSDVLEDVYGLSGIALLKEHYVAENPRTWPFYPIEMPLKNGYGPADIEACDQMTYEVWDQYSESHGSFTSLTAAIARAMQLNRALFPYD